MAYLRYLLPIHLGGLSYLTSAATKAAVCHGNCSLDRSVCHAHRENTRRFVSIDHGLQGCTGIWSSKEWLRSPPLGATKPHMHKRSLRPPEDAGLATPFQLFLRPPLQLLPTTVLADAGRVTPSALGSAARCSALIPSRGFGILSGESA